jgi:hypothetical protein
MKKFAIKYKKPLIITASICILQALFGWDEKFTLINLIWLMV